MSVAQSLNELADSIDGVEQWAYRSVANALEVIPRTIAQNCGANVVKLTTELRVCLPTFLLFLFPPPSVHLYVNTYIYVCVYPLSSL